MDRAFLQEMIDAIQEQIRAYNAAILALTTGQVQSYSLDTGQTKQTVTKNNLAALTATRQSLMNELCTLQARLDGSGSITVRPGF